MEVRKIKKLSNQGVSTLVAVIVTAIVVGIVISGLTYVITRPRPRKPPPEFEVGSLELSPSTVKWGETTTATIDVTNPKEFTDNLTVELKIEGKKVDTKTITLSPGETKSVSFDITKEELGSFDIEVAGKSKTLTVNPKFKIAVVSDIGGRGDLAFNDMAFKGGEEAEDDFGVEMVELISYTEADYLPNLREAAGDPDVKLIVGVGFLLTDSLVEAALEYPDKNFAGIDTSTKWTDAGGLKEVGAVLPNMMDVVYEEHKGSALVGALGALLAAYLDKPHIGGVFGIEIPVLWKFEIGYKWGAKWALEEWLPANKPDLAERIDYTRDFVLYTYTGTFSDVAKGKEAAIPMYDKGAVAVYNIAGPLGLGINSAVKERVPEKQTMGPPFWIGVDANQDWINPGFVIASMMKRVDTGVNFATELVDKGKFRDAVSEEGGQITLGVGTEVLGMSKEGISVSTLADLDEFIQMGVTAEERTGEKTLPMSPTMIRTRVKEMRDAQPDWIWEAVAELEELIRSGEPIADLDDDGTPETVPSVFTSEDISYWRGILG